MSLFRQNKSVYPLGKIVSCALNALFETRRSSTIWELYPGLYHFDIGLEIDVYSYCHLYKLGRGSQYTDHSPPTPRRLTITGNQSLFGLRASTCTLGGTELNVYHVSLRLKVNFTYKYVWGGSTMTATIIPY